jgi:hypothetical protein
MPLSNLGITNSETNLKGEIGKDERYQKVL